MELIEIIRLIMREKDLIIGAAIILTSLVQVAPIKVNPWTWCIIKLQKIMGITDLKDDFKEMRHYMDELDTKITTLKAEESAHRDLKEAYDSRRRILSFNDELLRDEKHSKEMFDNVLEDITYYDSYCRDHKDFINQKAVMAEANIKRVYQECMNERSFL